jgi:hypothetical protein
MAEVTDTFYSSEGFIGYGSQLLVGDGASPEQFVAIAEVHTITPGAITTTDIPRTHLRSKNAHAEHMPGLRDSAEFGVAGTLRLDHESQNNADPNGLIFLSRTRAIRNFQIKLSNDAEDVLPFRGYVSRFQIGEIGANALVAFTAGFMPTEDYSAGLPGAA